VGARCDARWHHQRNHIRGDSGLGTLAGHGHGKPGTEQIEENSYNYSFPFWQLG